MESEEKVGSLNVPVNLPLRMEMIQALEGFPTHIDNLLFFQGFSGPIDLLQGASSTELHADPQSVISEVAAQVSDHVGLLTFFEDGELLLEGADVIS